MLKCTIIFKLSNFQLKQKLFLLRLSLFFFNFLEQDIPLIYRTSGGPITRPVSHRDIIAAHKGGRDC